MRPCLLSPIDWEAASGCSYLSESLTLHQLGLTALVYPLHHSFVKQKMPCEGVYMCERLAPTADWCPLGFSLQASSGSCWQAWASVMLDWIIISLDPPPFLSPSCLFALPNFHTATSLCLSLSQGLGLATALTATEEGRKIEMIQNTQLRHIPEEN